MCNKERLVVELKENQPEAIIGVSWSTTGPVTVSVRLKGSAQPVSWVGPPVQSTAARLEKMIAGIKTFAGGTDFELKVHPLGSPVMTLLWNETGEPKELYALRREIELTAHVPYVMAKVAFDSGTSRKAAYDYAGAVHSYRAGIKELGTLYASPYLFDDTGMKLLLAEEKEGNKDVEGAAVLYGRVLESRLTRYSTKYALK
jgi:hypothetical protein